MYFTGQVDYPFGYGLSYASASYGQASIDHSTARPNDTVTVTVPLTNPGSQPVSEVVQLYVATPDSPAAAQRPTRRLAGFQRVTVAAGQSVEVKLPVGVADLAFFDDTAGKWVVDSGTYRFTVGSSSVDARSTLNVAVSGELEAAPATVTVHPIAEHDDPAVVTQRVTYSAGVVVTPRPTVVLNDDELFDKALPEGAIVSYTTDHPNVVSIDASGTIRTVAAGVATVTATVTMHGVSATTSFVLNVR
jgi:beta-glucosidase